MNAPRSPTMVEVLSQVMDSSASRLVVCKPGVVTQFHRETQTAQIRPVTLKADGTRCPTTVYTPIIFPGAYWDVQEGEAGLLICADEDWRSWWRTDEDSVSESEACHELSNAFFLPGVKSHPNSRILPVNAMVLEKPCAGGTVRLGAQDAWRAVLHEDLLPDFDSFLTDVSTAGISLNTAGTDPVFAALAPVAAAAIAAAGTTLIASVIPLKAGIAAGSYESPSVKVEH